MSQLSLPLVIANKIVMIDIPEFNAYADKYRDVLKRSDSIIKMQEHYSRELDKYEEYID